MVNLNTCQPGQQLIRRDALRAEYVGVNGEGESCFRHLVKVYYDDTITAVRSYKDDGMFCFVETQADIMEIIPMIIDDYRWSAKISPDRVEARSGFWAVYQGEA